MNFDFTNYTFSGLLSILASLYGVGYPLIIQSIGRIYSQYDSSLLANRFIKETVYRLFQVLLIFNLLFAVSMPFLLHAGWWNIVFVTMQALFLVLLMGITFLLFQLMIKYENAGELLKHIEGKQIDKNNIMDILDLAIYADSKNNHQLFKDAMLRVFSYIEIQQGDNCNAGRNNLSSPVEYDETVFAIVLKLKEFIREDDGHHLLHRNNDIVYFLYNSMSESRISLKTHHLMWILLNEAVTYNNHSWFKYYWQCADSYASFKFRFPDNDLLKEDKSEFMLRHVMVGALLLHNRRFQWFDDIFLYTHSEPEYYGLIPSTFMEIIHMLEEVDKLCDVFIFQQKGFYFANEMGGVNDEKFVFRKAVKYLSLLVIRLWSLRSRYMSECETLFQMPLPPKLIADDERAAVLMNMMISDIEYFYSNGIFSLISRLMKVDKAEVITLLVDYRYLCLSAKEAHFKNPCVDGDKFSYLKNEALQFVGKFEHKMPIDKPLGAEWDNISIKSYEVNVREQLDTLSYSPYQDYGNGDLVIWTDFVALLHRYYIQTVYEMKRLSTYNVHRNKLKEFLDTIGYNSQDYGLISTMKLAEIENPDVCLATRTSLSVFIIKKDEIPYVSFDKFEDDKLSPIKDDCAFSSNIDSFVDCCDPVFDLIIATKMNVYTKEQSHGVVHVLINEEYSRKETDITVEKQLAELFDA